MSVSGGRFTLARDGSNDEQQLDPVSFPTASPSAEIKQLHTFRAAVNLQHSWPGRISNSALSRRFIGDERAALSCRFMISAAGRLVLFHPFKRRQL